MPATGGAGGAGGRVMAGVSPRAWELSRDGDSALLLAFPARLDPGVNARCVSVAERLRGHRIRGVRDVVEAFATVTVHFDPVLGDVDEISAMLRRLAADTAAPADRGAGRARREIRLPVCYGGARGPDLADVARFARCRRGGGRRTPSQRGLSRLHAGVPTGFRVHGRRGPTDCGAAAQRAAGPRAGRLRRHRGAPDGRVSGRFPRAAGS